MVDGNLAPGKTKQRAQFLLLTINWPRFCYWAALSLSFRQILMFMNIIAWGPQVKILLKSYVNAPGLVSCVKVHLMCI